MILWTVMPEHLVLEGIDDPHEQTSEIVVDGILMEVRPLSGQEAEVVRILSPDPQHYLNPDLSPGSIIAYIPSLRR